MNSIIFELFKQYGIDILVVVAFVAVLGYLVKIGKTDTVKKIILSLVVQAEKALGSGTGELKYAFVVDALYSKLPAIIRLLYSKKEINQFIEDAVQELKKTLDSGNTLSSYENEHLFDNIH
jgi:hypothetical protein